MSDTKVWVENSEAVQAVEEEYTDYMSLLYESVEDESIEPAPITGEPFCGCDTCARRETFAFVFRAAADLIKSGALKVEYKEQ